MSRYKTKPIIDYGNLKKKNYFKGDVELDLSINMNNYIKEPKISRNRHAKCGIQCGPNRCQVVKRNQLLIMVTLKNGLFQRWRGIRLFKKYEQLC